MCFRCRTRCADSLCSLSSLCSSLRHRYVYYAPGRQTDKTQSTSPFDSFWYCCTHQARSDNVSMRRTPPNTSDAFTLTTFPP